MYVQKCRNAYFVCQVGRNMRRLYRSVIYDELSGDVRYPSSAVRKAQYQLSFILRIMIDMLRGTVLERSVQRLGKGPSDGTT